MPDIGWKIHHHARVGKINNVYNDMFLVEFLEPDKDYTGEVPTFFIMSRVTFILLYEKIKEAFNPA